MRVHFIGIGGIGVSALAQYYLAKGHKVSGSDLTHSEMTDLLRKKGAKVFIRGHDINSKFEIRNSNLIIYSPAVPQNDPELRLARKLKIETLSYPEALGELTKQYFTIAVCGTHGKSTTTAMLALVLIKAGLNPTVILGTKLKEFNNSNFRMGGIPKSKILNLKSEVLVIEADEHFASFLHYWPKMIVLTNIEADHLDYYKNLNNIKRAFKEFIGHLPKNGILIQNAKYKPLTSLAVADARRSKMQNAKLRLKIKNYPLRQKDAEKLRRVLRVPGEHNISNASAVLVAARALKIPDKTSFKALSHYRGAWRRFEVIQRATRHAPFTILSDYAHHPTEIKATIRAAKEKFSGKKIWAIFQPHQTARTVTLFDGFVKAFDEAGAVVLTNIFEVPGREFSKPPKGRDMKTMMEKIKKRGKETYFVSNFRKIPKFLKKKVDKGDIILIMGAGNIYLIADPNYWRKTFQHSVEC